MWATTSGVAMRGAMAHDQFFHRCFRGTCRFIPACLDTLETFSVEAIKRRLVDWAERCGKAFDVAHPWPVAVRAAALIRQSGDRAWSAPDLARAVGASCSTLERGFKIIYGTTPQRYQRIVHLRKTVRAIRNDDESLEGLVLGVGWRSVKDAHRAVRSTTGLTLSAVRRLSDDDFMRLIGGPLSLQEPGRFVPSPSERRNRSPVLSREAEPEWDPITRVRIGTLTTGDVARS
jgi:AraC-like DNA-binding protein